MIFIFGDLIADLSMRIPDFPVNAQDLKPLSYLEIGPGGATNIAIMAARFGLQVGCIGEIGADQFGEVVRNGLQREHIDTTHVVVSADGKTPVAGVLVDRQREPAYLGYAGDLRVKTLRAEWRAAIQSADALFADGWVEIAEMPQMILDAFEVAHAARVPIFFDPGYGNPAFDNAWHQRAAALSTVLLVNNEEALRVSGMSDSTRAVRTLLSNGAQWVVLKLGAAGLMLTTPDGVETLNGFPVAARDLTGAGDSVTGAILYGYLHEMKSRAIGILANATGAAKVQKLGTGHNLPTLDEIKSVLEKFSPEHANLVPQQ